MLFHDLKEDSGDFHNIDGLATIQTETGLVTFQGNTIRTDRIRVFDDGVEKTLDYGNRSGWVMDIAQGDGFAALHDGQIDSTLAHELYVKRMASPYFEPVLVDGARFQLWRVKQPDPPGNLGAELRPRPEQPLSLRGPRLQAGSANPNQLVSLRQNTWRFGATLVTYSHEAHLAGPTMLRRIGHAPSA